MKKKVCFKTWCTDNHRDIIGIEQLTNQLKHFHPDIPHFIYGDKEMEEDSKKFPWAEPRVMMPISMMRYIDDYELVIHIDGDSTIVGPLDELINAEYDAAGVRNNHFGGGAGWGSIITIPEVPWNKFLNVGLNAVRSKEFLLDWVEGCRIGCQTPGWDDENNEYNRHFFKEKYKTVIIDDVGSNISYGLTNVFGRETHWDSWKGLYVRDGEIYQINPIGEEVKVKILHMAGGGGAKAQVFQGRTMREWLHGWVQPEVSEYIKNIES
jgi:hypothetical protein